MKNKIAQRLALYFALVLLLFALLSGVLFSFMFARHTATVATQDLQAHALSIAGTVKHFVSAYRDGECKGGGFKSYLRFVGQFALSDLYLLDRQGDAVVLGEMEPPDTPLPEAARPLVCRVFDTGETISQTFAPDNAASDHLIACTPITDDAGNTLYVLALVTSIHNVDHALHDSVYILAASLGIALALAIAVSVHLSRRFVTPLHRMMATTTKLMDGDYGAKTRVAQDDEIGTLARHIDALADQLSAVEEERRQLDEMRQSFFSDISHELRTPIAVLKGNVELLHSGMIPDPIRQKEIYQQLFIDTAHMERLVNDLLELTRLQNPRFSISMDVISLTDVLSDTVSSMRRRADKKQIAIRYDDQTGPFPVMADYGRLRQLMIILLDNAIKFSPEGACIALTAQRTGGACWVTVEDQGVGMDEETLAHIFDRYFHDRSARNSGGTGLGLPIAREIALRHGIQMTCESQPGKGTCFTLVFKGCEMPEDA